MTRKEQSKLDHFFTARFRWHERHPAERDFCEMCEARLDGQIEEEECFCYCHDRPLEIEAFEATVSDFHRHFPQMTSEEFFMLINDQARVHLPTFDVHYRGEDRMSWLVSYQAILPERQIASRLRRPAITSLLWRLLESLLPARDHEAVLGDLEEEFSTLCRTSGKKHAYVWLLWQMTLSLMDVLLPQLVKALLSYFIG